MAARCLQKRLNQAMRCSERQIPRHSTITCPTGNMPKWQQAANSLGLNVNDLQHHRKRHRSSLAVCALHALPFASIALQQAAQPALASAPASVALPAVLLSAGVFILCCAAAVLLLSAIPLLWSMTKAANRMESMLQTLEVEVPDTAASMRLSSLELSDCLNELGALGNDLSSGVRSTARLITAADSGVRQGGQLVVSAVVPALAKRETQLRDAVEAALKARTALAPQLPAVRAAVGATTTSVRRFRGVLFAAGVAVDLGRAVRARLTEAALQQLVAQRQLLTADAARQQQPLKDQQAGFRGPGLSNEAATTRAA